MNEDEPGVLVLDHHGLDRVPTLAGWADHPPILGKAGAREPGQQRGEGA